MRNPEITMHINEIRHMNELQLHVQSQINETTRPTPGDTALHEAKHVVAAIHNGTDVNRVTIEPGPGYLGLTELARPDAIAAAAPHADGCSGTDHDVHVVLAMGHSIGSVSGIAGSIVRANHEQVQEVATVLEEKRTIGSYDVKEAMNIDRKKREKNKAKLTIRNANGEEKVLQTETRNGKVIVPGEWITFNQTPALHGFGEDQEALE